MVAADCPLRFKNVAPIVAVIESGVFGAALQPPAYFQGSPLQQGGSVEVAGRDGRVEQVGGDLGAVDRLDRRGHHGAILNGYRQFSRLQPDAVRPHRGIVAVVCVGTNDSFELAITTPLQAEDGVRAGDET